MFVSLVFTRLTPEGELPEDLLPLLFLTLLFEPRVNECVLLTIICLFVGVVCSTTRHSAAESFKKEHLQLLRLLVWWSLVVTDLKTIHAFTHWCYYYVIN